MYEKQLQIFQQQSELPFSFEEIGTLDVERLQRRKRKIRRVTQGHGSMEGQQILERMEELEEEEENARCMKEQKKQKNAENIDNSNQCAKRCKCKRFVCLARGFRQCTQCKDVFKKPSKCSKKRCKREGIVMETASNEKKKKILRVCDVNSNED